MNAEIRRTKARLAEEAGHEKDFNSEYYEDTEQSSQFRLEYEMQKMKQDEGLDFISRGLDTLENLATDMNEELDSQVPLIGEIDKKVTTPKDLFHAQIRLTRRHLSFKKNNVRLKENLMQMRSSRNFCIDIILLSIVLGIAIYLYKYVF